MANDTQVDILLVEDNPDDAELAMHAFRKHNISNSVHHVKDGAEALDFLLKRGVYEGRSDTPKVVLLDLKLPKIDGLEVLRCLKENAETRTVPVVILTASKQESDLVESYGLGANSYIVKPVDFTQFTDAVRDIGMYWLLLNQPPTATESSKHVA